MNQMIRRHTLSVLVENHAGVLSKISGLFARRGFNIDSLAVGATEDPTLSRITIVVTGDDHTVEQIEKQLNKLIDVIKVKTLKPEELISRALLLIKVGATAATRGEVMNVADIMGAKIVDISLNTLTLSLDDTSDRCDLLIAMLRPYQIKEIATTGVIALEKGTETITGKKKVGI